MLCMIGVSAEFGTVDVAREVLKHRVSEGGIILFFES